VEEKYEKNASGFKYFIDGVSSICLFSRYFSFSDIQCLNTG